MIQSVAQHKAQAEKGKKKKKSPIQWQAQFTQTVANISQPRNAQTHVHAYTITKQGFGVWEFEGVYVCEICTVNWVLILFDEMTDVCSATKTVNLAHSAFGKPPHSYSNRLMATNSETKNNKTLTMDGFD